MLSLANADDIKPSFFLKMSHEIVTFIASIHDNKSFLERENPSSSESELSAHVAHVCLE